MQFLCDWSNIIERNSRFGAFPALEELKFAPDHIVEQDGLLIAAQSLTANQYSSGSRMQVELRSASVMM
jgi:hypothetical protein